MIGYGFAFHWLRKWHEFCQPIIEQSVSKTKANVYLVRHSIENCYKTTYKFRKRVTLLFLKHKVVIRVQPLKARPHVKLNFANFCFQKQVGVCEWGINSCKHLSRCRKEMKLRLYSSTEVFGGQVVYMKALQGPGIFIVRIAIQVRR